MARAASARALRGLYAITPAQPDTRRLVHLVERALAGGAALVQYRAKGLGERAMLAQARELAALCRGQGVPLIVNDCVEVARACGADGVHLGRDDIAPARARALMPDAIIGVSCYADLARARQAGREGADYIGIGSIFASATKPAAVRAPLEMLAHAKRESGLPVAAIGGIDTSNAQDAVAAGADMIAVISALFDAADVEGAARRFASFFS
ncbi:MAG TPA: thiamine phosphate synthase [Usitatibacter sp.]|jgi:thiamine-phosphate pyrophosphorylase|nr:thiamine phosphate synthase [Usitatibacter sp.]